MPSQIPVIAFIALGSNLGDRFALMRSARRRLMEHPAISACRSSSLYETEPVGGPPGQGLYLNAVLRLTTTLTAPALLDYCLTVEAELGRVRGERWGARTIDLDLLLYNDLVLATPGLHLPHPRLHLRRFVLFPLAELAPGLMHPLLRRSVAELAAACPDTGEAHRLPEEW